MHPLVLIFALCGLLLVGLAIPLIKRKVRPNSLHGLRVRTTFADERVWYEANERHGWDMLRLGVVLIVLAVLRPLTGLGDEAFTILWVLAATVGALSAAIIGWRRANRLLEERKRTQVL